MARISILRKKEIEEFDNPIIVEEEQRVTCFSLDLIEDFGLDLRKPISKVGFLLQLGYFILQRKFFVPQKFHEADIKYVLNLLELENIDIRDYKKASYNKHRKQILSFFNYKSFNYSKHILINEAQELVKTSIKPREMFFSMVDFLNEKRIEIPKYYIFSEIIAKSLSYFELYLEEQIGSILNTEHKAMLDEFITSSYDENTSYYNSPYLITKLKKPSQSLATKKIKESIKDFKAIEELHKIFFPILEKLGISNELLNYYAVWVVKAEHFQFESISSMAMKRIYLISFIIYQYRLRQDFFVDSFIECTKSYRNKCNKEVDNLLKGLKKKKLSFKKGYKSKVSRVLKDLLIERKEISNILYYSNFNSKEKVELIEKILPVEVIEKLSEEIIEQLSELNNLNIDKLENNIFYERLSINYRQLQNKCGNLLLILRFNRLNSDHKLIEAIDDYKRKNGNIDNTSPYGFINPKSFKKIYDRKGNVNKGLYKVILYDEIANGIKSGALNLEYSNKYKSINDYLISSDVWKKNKEKLIQRANLDDFKDPIFFLEHQKKQLDNQYITSNKLLENNEYVRIINGGISIKTPKKQLLYNSGISQFIGEEKEIPLSDILTDVDEVANLQEAFQHYSRKTGKKSIQKELLFAGIMALGCNIGIRKMGKISKNLKPERLERSVQWYFSKGNIDEANRRINALIDNLSLPKLFQKSKNNLQTSSDGQKFNVSVPALHAKYSYKYFGHNKGVSAYSFIDDKNRLFYGTIISTTEREASYVLDGIMHNEGINIEMHSTDTHGYTEIIFGLCNALGVYFAPRISSPSSQILYSFKGKSRLTYENAGYKLLPNKSMYINEQLLIEQWDNILRLICSIKLKESKASTVLSRLNTYSFQNPLNKALKELGRIYKTRFLLKYTVDVELRKKIEMRLNSIELSHKFAKAVYFDNNREFKDGDKINQEIALKCRHLIQNAIVLWNYLYVSQTLALLEQEKVYMEYLKIIKGSSFNSWQHINFLGIYDFNSSLSKKKAFEISRILELKIE